jgi:hypothetical protein
MFSFDTTQIALYLSLVLTVAAIGLTLVFGVLADSVVRNRRTRHKRHESLRAYYGRLALHH